MIQASG